MHWKWFNEKSSPLEGPINKQSPFGYYCFELCEKLKINLNNKRAPKKLLSDNFFYSIKFLKYFLNSIFPYAPLMNKMLLKINDLPLERDLTNNVVESWNNLLKNHDLKKEIPAKLGRFVRKEYKNIKG